MRQRPHSHQRPHSACGLGALNVYWLFAGGLIAVLNVLPMSYDCTLAMPSWLGVAHECNSIETFLNYVWCIAVFAWGLTCFCVALLPKLVNNYPASANKAVMMAVSIASLPLTAAHLFVGFKVKVTLEDGTNAPLTNFVYMSGSLFVLLLIAFIVNREPRAGYTMS